MHLYQLSDDYQKVWDLLEAEEIDEQAILDTLEGIQGEVQQKAISIACFIKELKATVSAFKAEEDNMRKRRYTLERQIARLQTYLSDNMEKADLAKITDPKATISFRQNKSTFITDYQGFLDWARANNRKEFIVEEEPTISKTAVKAALEKGEDIPHAEIVTTKSILIK